jgi:hypothetical protein
MGNRAPQPTILVADLQDIADALREPIVAITFAAVTTVTLAGTAAETGQSGDFQLITWLVKAQGSDGTCTSVIVTPEYSADGNTWFPGTAFATLSTVLVATAQYQVATTAVPCKYFRFSVATQAYQAVVTITCFGLPR